VVEKYYQRIWQEISLFMLHIVAILERLAPVPTLI
jgi:hypothetical protein